MRLKQAQRLRGKSQQEVAVENGLGVFGYRKIESGDVRRPGITSVYGIARSVGTNPHDVDEFAATLNEYEAAIGLTATAHQQGGGAEHFYSQQRFESAVQDEVQRRLTVASQSSEERTST